MTGPIPFLILALLVSGLGVPLPEDPIVLVIGAATHRAELPWAAVLGMAFAGALAADMLLFALATHFGGRFLARRPFRWLLSYRREQHVKQLFQRHGARAVFYARHSPTLRPVAFALAGIHGVSFGQFLLWDFWAALLSVPVTFGLGYVLSVHEAALHAGVARTEHWLGVLLGAGLLIAKMRWVGKRITTA